uniref:Uncharacterized protein n=1 Tax=viral metagenome TaxID=1070528 RepID=A0A6M3IWZ0_9ZZZZ
MNATQDHVSTTVHRGKIIRAVIKTEVKGRAITIALDRTIDGDAWICSREGKKTARKENGKKGGPSSMTLSAF